MKLTKLICLMSLALNLFTVKAQSILPTGAQIMHGNAQTIQMGNNLNVMSSTKYNVISWKDFSVGANNNVIFDSNSYLNIVRDSKPSVIQGNVFSAGGEFYLVNPNGISISKGANIEAAKVHLSTAKLSTSAVNRYLMGNDLEITNKGMGKISLVGNITAANLKIDGSHVIIGNIENIKTVKTDSAPVNLNNKDGNNFEIASSVNRIDVGGSNSVNLEDDYGFTKDKGFGSQLGKTAISTEEDMKNIAVNMNGDYFITNDINLTDMKDSIGSNNAFTGSIDGCFNTVTYQITKDSVNTENQGLFSTLDGATIKNLKIADSSIEITNSDRDLNVGALAGKISGANISNVDIDRFNVNISSNNKVNVGALTGVIANEGYKTKLENVVAGFDAKTQIKYANNQNVNLGAIAGTASGNLSVNGTVIAKTDSSEVNGETFNGQVKAFGKNNTAVNIDNYKAFDNSEYIEINNELVNKNFYTPYFVEDNYVFTYDKNSNEVYDYTDFTDNPYFKQENYVNVDKVYDGLAKDPGEYSHILSNKKNGTQFYFVQGDKIADSIDHKIIINNVFEPGTQIPPGSSDNGFNGSIDNGFNGNVENVFNGTTAVNNNYFSNTVNIENYNDLKELKDSTKKSEAKIKAIRLNMTQNKVINPDFLAALETDNDNLLALSKESVDEQI